MDVRWLARVAASAAVRRLVYLAIAALLGLVAMCGKAHAQTDPYVDCTNVQRATATCETSGQASAQVMAAAQASWGGGSGSKVCGPYQFFPGTSNQRWLAYVADVNRTCASNMTYYVVLTRLYTWEVQNCATALPYGPAMSSSLYMCSGGCRYEMGSSSGLSVCLGSSGPDMTCMGSNWTPTGGTCEANDKPPSAFDPAKETCRSLGGGDGSYSECVKPNGDHCVTSAKGAVLCWKPSETGDRITTDGITGADREVAPAEPAPPSNQENPTQQGPTSTTTINGNTYNTSIYSGTGNTGGQGNTGTGGKNTGGTGDPKGEGEGEGEGDKDGAGSVGAGVGTLYEGSGKTVSSVFNAFKAQIEASPLINAATSFLSVTVSASCPVFSVPETAFWPAMQFTYHCQGDLADALALGAYLLLAIAAYTAFKVGIGY